MSQPAIDIESESIWLEDRWVRKDELAALIKHKLDAGDFAIGALSQALEKLHTALANARVVAFRVEAELADALAAAAQQAGVSMGALLRQAALGMLAAQPQPPPHAAPTIQVPAESAPLPPSTPNPTLVLQLTEPAPAQAPLALTQKAARPKTDEAELSWFRNEG